MPISPDALILGVDGGGSGCRAVLADGAGRVLGRGEAGPANIHSDRAGALAAVMAAAGAALGGRDPAPVCAVLGLAGAEVAGGAGLAADLPFGRVRVVQDAVTALHGALGAGDGIVAAIGTGSVFSRRLDGAVKVIGGRGWVLGDEGGGAWLGRALMARALRAADGVAPTTPLLQAVLDDFGGIAGVIAHAAQARAADFAAVARRLAAAPHDPAAQALLTAAGADLALYIDRLQPLVPLPVVFTGGLGPLYAARLAGRWPIRAAQGGPLDGALAMARELATAPVAN